MCGIFGLVASKNSGLNKEKRRRLVDDLFILSESRGKEAAGLAWIEGREIKIYKRPVPASVLIKEDDYQKIWEKNSTDNLALMGHARLVTNGSQLSNNNNQPVVKDGLIAVHNGIVVNVEALWQRFSQLKQEDEVDTEIVLALANYFWEQEKSLAGALEEVYKVIEGTVSLALFSDKLNKLFLTTNNGSLYVVRNQEKGIFVFASEKYILERLVKKSTTGLFDNAAIKQIKSRQGMVVDLETTTVVNFDLTTKTEMAEAAGEPRKILELSPKTDELAGVFKNKQKKEVPDEFLTAVAEARQKIEVLKRCTKCILPETFPFIEFDEEGVCNYCHHYQPIKIESEEKLNKLIEKYRRSDGEPGCLATFSGGRDSSFGLHYIKNVLDLKPVAYSYDWGMITDLGRRNQARMCGQLGVEHILVSADIKKKRENIRKNVLAWLKKPNLGTVPLFMAGDKQFFYYANKLRRQMKLPAVIMSQNPLEKTNFKSGFCGSRPDFSSSAQFYGLSFVNQLRQFFYYARQVIKNPAYLNSSIWDTLWGYVSYYLISHRYIFLFKYKKWDEKEIENVLIKEYNWELARDTRTSWRIGDATAAFYNYIYYLAAGFTENDTFRSNQIREGMISREEAMRRSREDNEIRWESILWYSETVGIDFEETIRKINAMPKLY